MVEEQIHKKDIKRYLEVIGKESFPNKKYINKCKKVLHCKVFCCNIYKRLRMPICFWAMICDEAGGCRVVARVFPQSMSDL